MVYPEDLIEVKFAGPKYVTDVLIDIQTWAINVVPMKGKQLAAHFPSPEAINQGCASFGNMTAMHFAVAFRSGPILLKLLTLGGSIWTPDDDGNSPYDLARIIHGKGSQCFSLLDKVMDGEVARSLSIQDYMNYERLNFTQF